MLFFKHTATLAPRYTTMKALLTGWLQALHRAETGQPIQIDPALVTGAFEIGAPYLLGITPQDIRNNTDLIMTSNTLQMWRTLFQHKDIFLTGISSDWQSTLDEVTQHLITLVPVLMEKPSDISDIAVFKIRLFAEHLGLLPPEKIPLQTITTFFQTIVQKDISGILNETQNHTAQIMSKALIVRIPDITLPSPLFEVLAKFLTERLVRFVSEDPVFFQFLAYDHWPTPASKLPTETADALYKMGYDLDNPHCGRDFSEIFSLGIVPRLGDAARTTFRDSPLLQDAHKDSITDYMDELFSVGVLQLLSPKDPLIGKTLIRILSHVERLPQKPGVCFDVLIANHIIASPETVLHPAIAYVRQEAPLTHFCLDGTLPPVDHLSATMSGPLILALTKAFLAQDGPLPETLARLVLNATLTTAESNERAAHIRQHLDKFAPFLTSKQFKQEFQKIQNPEQSEAILSQLLAAENTPYRDSHLDAVALPIVAGYSFGALLAGYALPHSWCNLALDFGRQKPENLKRVLLYIAQIKPATLSTDLKDSLRKALPQLCEAWITAKLPVPDTLPPLLQYAPETPNKWVAFAHILTQTPLPAGMANAIVSGCYSLISDDDTVLVAQTTLASQTVPDAGQRFSDAIWNRLSIITASTSPWAMQTLETMLSGITAAPQRWTYLHTTLSRCCHTATDIPLQRVMARTMATFSPEHHQAEWCSILRDLPKSKHPMTIRLAMESPTPLRYLRLMLSIGYAEVAIRSVLSEGNSDIQRKFIPNYIQHLTKTDHASLSELFKHTCEVGNASSNAVVSEIYLAHWQQQHPNTPLSHMISDVLNTCIKETPYSLFQRDNPYLAMIPKALWEALNEVLQTHQNPLFSKACTLAQLCPDKVSHAIQQKYPWLCNPQG